MKSSAESIYYNEGQHWYVLGVKGKIARTSWTIRGARGRPLLSGRADINARLNVIFNDRVLHLPGPKHTVQLRPNL